LCFLFSFSVLFFETNEQSFHRDIRKENKLSRVVEVEDGFV